MRKSLFLRFEKFISIIAKINLTFQYDNDIIKLKRREKPMKQKIEAMNVYFARQIAACNQKEQALRQDERQDEAVFEKIRANVYDIFRTALAAGVRTCGEDEAAVKQFFLQKLRQIPFAWEKAREAAAQHGDDARVQLEDIKLEVVQQIRAQLAMSWGEAS